MGSTHSICTGKNGEIRFCVEIHIALTDQKSCPIRRIERGIDLRGEATSFFTLDARRRYKPVAKRDHKKQLSHHITHFTD